MALSNKSKRGLKICCTATAILIIALVVTAVILYFTILKPKQPKIITRAVTLESIKWVPSHLNITLGLKITVDNRRNYGSFKHGNGTTSVSYGGEEVGKGLVAAGTIPARGTQDFLMTVLLLGDKMLLNPNFESDFLNGGLNFTSSTALHGALRVWRIIKVKGSSLSTCDISVSKSPQNATAVCSSKIKY